MEKPGTGSVIIRFRVLFFMDLIKTSKGGPGSSIPADTYI